MKIFLDAGHGGKDSGAYNYAIKLAESAVDTRVVYHLANELKAKGYTVKKAKLLNGYMDINSRWKMANEWGADFFISIHQNSCNVQSVEGTEVLVYSKKDNEIVSRAEAICNEICQELNTKKRGVKVRNDLGVLKYSKMPAVLVECDFISNNAVAKKMKTLEWNKSIAKAIAKTFPAIK